MDAPRALVGFGSVFGLAASNGGFFPTSWGWAALPLLLVTCVALVVRQELVVTVAEGAFFALAATLTLWTALSSVWSSAPAASLLETDRALVYVAALAAVLAVGGRRSPAPLAGGLLLASVGICVWALWGRLAPVAPPPASGLGAYRLTGPVGYWNGLGLLAVLGSLLALGFVTHGNRTATRALAASSLVVFLPTLVFTFTVPHSRLRSVCSSWLSLSPSDAHSPHGLSRRLRRRRSPSGSPRAHPV